MGFLAILMSFLQSMFFFIKVFRNSKQRVKQIDYIQWYADTSLSPFQDEPLIISYHKAMAIGGRSQERGGQCKGYYCGHLRKPSGQLSGNPRMVVGHVPPARARSIQFSSILEASPPQGFVFHQSILFLSSSIVPLLPPICKVPFTLIKTTYKENKLTKNILAVLYK